MAQFSSEVVRLAPATTYVWFRGEPKSSTPLLPKLYRPRPGRRAHNEKNLLQNFRLRAPALGTTSTPDRGATDQWLYLAQHVGLPTRLLDWTEGALTALLFALAESQAESVVWMLNAEALNRKVQGPQLGLAPFDLPWIASDHDANFAARAVDAAWTNDDRAVELPYAIYPTNIHPRMTSQRSCFTIQGRSKASLVESAPEFLVRFDLATDHRSAMRQELRRLGVTHGSVFPDLDGLARELAEFG